MGSLPAQTPSASPEPATVLTHKAGMTILLAALPVAALVGVVGLGISKHAFLVDALETLCAVTTAAVVLWGAHRRQDARRTYWLLMGYALVMWAVGDVIWSLYRVKFGVDVPFPSLADPAYLLFYPLSFLATISLLPKGAESFDRLRLLGDALMIVLGSLVLMWRPIVQPILSNSHMSMLGQSLSILYPVGDLLLLSAIVLPIPLPIASRRWQLWGLLFFFSADTLYAAATNQGLYAVGNWFDPVWYVALLLLLISSLYDSGQAPPKRPPGVQSNPLRVMGPYLALTAAVPTGLLLALRASGWETIGLVSGFAFAFAAVSAIRQWAYLGENAHLVAQARELTQHLEQRVAERTAQLEQRSQELAEANRLKSEFLATMSHELRTPMNGIIGYTQVLLDGLDGPLTSDQIEDLQHIGTSAERLLSLINDILDLSKIEAGRVVLERQRTSLEEAIADVMDTVAPMVSAKGVRLISEVQETPPLNADPQRLRQILLNLVSNAIKFTDEGEVRIVAEPIEDGLAISVHDTGIGIPESAQAYVFDEFRQVDGSSSRRHGGTGLGLAITRRLVALHGGTINLKSRVGGGSTFTFTMPTHHTAQGLMLVAPLPVERKRPVVLCIDDDQHALDLLARFLEATGAELHVARTAAAGIEMGLSLRPDLVTLDLQLPDAAGWTVLSELRAKLGQAVGIILLSVVDDKPQGLRHGADAYLVKPIRKDELLHTVQHALAMRLPQAEREAAVGLFGREEQT